MHQKMRVLNMLCKKLSTYSCSYELFLPDYQKKPQKLATGYPIPLNLNC
jgi:hypothetical protein